MFFIFLWCISSLPAMEQEPIVDRATFDKHSIRYQTLDEHKDHGTFSIHLTATYALCAQSQFHQSHMYHVDRTTRKSTYLFTTEPIDRAIRLTADEQLICLHHADSSSYDVRKREAALYTLQGTRKIRFNFYVESIDLHPTESNFLALNTYNNINTFDIESKKFLYNLPSKTGSKDIQKITYNTAGNGLFFLLRLGREKSYGTIDLREPYVVTEPTIPIQKSYSRIQTDFAISPNEQYIAITTEHNGIYIYDLCLHKLLCKVGSDGRHNERYSDLFFINSTTLIATDKIPIYCTKFDCNTLTAERKSLQRNLRYNPKTQEVALVDKRATFFCWQPATDFVKDFGTQLITIKEKTLHEIWLQDHLKRNFQMPEAIVQFASDYLFDHPQRTEGAALYSAVKQYCTILTKAALTEDSAWTEQITANVSEIKKDFAELKEENDLWHSREKYTKPIDLRLFNNIELANCPVCTKEFVLIAYEKNDPHSTITLNCGHIFCIDCYAQLKSNACPLCRAPIETVKKQEEKQL